MFVSALFLYFLLGMIMLMDVPRPARVHYLTLLALWPLWLLMALLEPLCSWILRRIRK